MAAFKFTSRLLRSKTINMYGLNSLCRRNFVDPISASAVITTGNITLRNCSELIQYWWTPRAKDVREEIANNLSNPRAKFDEMYGPCIELFKSRKDEVLRQKKHCKVILDGARYSGFNSGINGIGKSVIMTNVVCDINDDDDEYDSYVAIYVRAWREKEMFLSHMARILSINKNDLGWGEIMDFAELGFEAVAVEKGKKALLVIDDVSWRIPYISNLEDISRKWSEKPNIAVILMGTDGAVLLGQTMKSLKEKRCIKQTIKPFNDKQMFEYLQSLLPSLDPDDDDAELKKLHEYIITEFSPNCIDVELAIKVYKEGGFDAFKEEVSRLTDIIVQDLKGLCWGMGARGDKTYEERVKALKDLYDTVGSDAFDEFLWCKAIEDGGVEISDSSSLCYKMVYKNLIQHISEARKLQFVAPIVGTAIKRL